MKKIKTKNIIITVGGIIVYFCVLFLLVKVIDQDTTYVFIHQNTRFSYSNKRWKALDSADKKVVSMNGNNFDVYTKNVFRGNFSLSYLNENYLIYDTYRNSAISLEGEIIAISGDENLTISETKTVRLELDTELLSSALEEIAVFDDFDVLFYDQACVDYNSDGVDEIVVSVNGETKDDVISLVYLIVGDNPIVITYDKVNNFNSFLIKNLSYYASLSVNNQDDNIIVSQSTTSERIPYCHHLYEIKNGESKLLVSSCEEEVE